MLWYTVGQVVLTFLGKSLKIKIQSSTLLKFGLADIMHLDVGRVGGLPSVYFLFWLSISFFFFKESCLFAISAMLFEWNWLYTLDYTSRHMIQMWPKHSSPCTMLPGSAMEKWLGSETVGAVRREAPWTCEV